jgi:hypothetical protein
VGDGWTIKGGSLAVTLDSCFALNNQHYSLWVTGNSVAAVSGLMDSDQGSNAVNALKVDAGSHLTETDCFWTGTRSVAANTVTILDNGSGAASFGGAITSAGVAVPTISSTDTLTNKRVTPRTSNVTNQTSWTISADSVDIAGNTSIAGNLTINNPTGTPTSGQELKLFATATGAFTVAYGTAFEASAITLPTAISTTRLDMTFRWNTATAKWRLVSATVASGGGGSTRYTKTLIATGTPSFTVTGLDMLVGDAISANITGITVTGSPQDGDRLLVRIKDNGTSRTFAPGSSFQNSDSATAPTATTVGKYHVLLYQHVTAVSKYVLMSYTTF